jgi:UDP-N-acetyl-D-mannosaminuronic acid transferase (WecB/TagA/CpsF family)
MGLLNTYTSANCVVDTALSVDYARRVVFGNWVETTGTVPTVHNHIWEYTRTATKTFRYVGMDEATAESCAAALRTLFNRSTRVSTWNGAYGRFDRDPGGDVPMADIVCQHEAAGMWTVTVSVNEQDTYQSLFATESFATIFATENARVYDLDEEGSD